MKSFSNIEVFSNRSKAFEALNMRTKGFQEFKLISEISQYKGICRRWVILSRGKLPTLRNFLVGKLIWENLSTFEAEIFLLLPNILQDPLIVNLLSEINRGVARKDIREKLKILNLFGYKTPSKEQFYSLKSQCFFFFYSEEVQLRKIKPYSGYTRHYKDHGSLAPQFVDNIPTTEELLDALINEEDELCTFFALSQDKLALVFQVGKSLADDAKIKQKQRLLFTVIKSPNLWYLK
jgi:hypothetical protein